MDLISSRRRKITAKAEELVAAFEARFGRAPNGAGARAARPAGHARYPARRSRTTGETREELLDRVDAQLRADVAGGLAGVAARPCSTPAASRPDRAGVVAAGGDRDWRSPTCSGARPGWTRADLTRGDQRRAARPPRHPRRRRRRRAARQPHRRGVGARRLARPRPARRRRCCPTSCGSPTATRPTQRPASRCTRPPEHVRTERAARRRRPRAGGAAGAAARGGASGSSTGCASPGSSSASTRPPRCAACSPPARGSRRWSARPAPASRSSSARSPAAWTDPDAAAVAERRGCSGSPPRQIATDVLAGEGLTAPQHRPLARHPGPARRRARLRQPQPIDGDEAWRLRAGDLVVVDESAMTDTAALAAIHRHVRRGRGEAAAGRRPPPARRGRRRRRHGPARQRRRAATSWPRPAGSPTSGSARRRCGCATATRPCCASTTSTAGSSTAAPPSRPRPSAARAWLADTLAGRTSLLMVDTNEQAARLSAQLRAELVRLGRVDRARRAARPRRAPSPGSATSSRPGCNGWDLAGLRGQPPRPDQPRDLPGHRRPRRRRPRRRPDRSADGRRAAAGGADGAARRLRRRAPRAGYASTVHAAQGRTVDTCHAVVTVADRRWPRSTSR